MTHHFFATCARGTEGALRDELREIGISNPEADHGGVQFNGPLSAGMLACLWSRVAARVLLEIGRGPARDASSLYETTRGLRWEEHMDADRTFAVRATLKRSTLTHTKFVALKVKDALVDRLRDQEGRRPNVDTRRPDLAISVHIAHDQATFHLDMAEEPLHRRGWRSEGGQAPLKESLAAAILRIGGYQASLPLCDPMCGSGTFVIEAALLARDIAPGLKRGFGFERWPSFSSKERSLWREMRGEAKERALPRAPAPIIASDRSLEAIAAATRNAHHAGVSKDIHFEQRDARSLDELPENCQIFSNPPYGERLGRRRLQLDGLYRQIGENWFSRSNVSRIVIFSANPRLERLFGHAPFRRHVLRNGPIECQLLEYTGEMP